MNEHEHQLFPPFVLSIDLERTKSNPCVRSMLIPCFPIRMARTGRNAGSGFLLFADIGRSTGASRIFLKPSGRNFCVTFVLCQDSVVVLLDDAWCKVQGIDQCSWLVSFSIIFRWSQPWCCFKLFLDDFVIRRRSLSNCSCAQEAYSSLPVDGEFVSKVLPDACTFPARRVVFFLGLLADLWHQKVWNLKLESSWSFSCYNQLLVKQAPASFLVYLSQDWLQIQGCPRSVLPSAWVSASYLGR